MRPTSTELEFLKLLWKESPRTARELHQELEGILQWGYSSTRKTLDRMAEKALVTVTKEGNVNLFAPQVDKVKTLASFAADFAKRVFELDGPLPTAMFTGSKLIDDDEIDQLEHLLEQLRKEQEQ
ncbi:BlaI/MecI/CopY family transcriptional regulator [Thalassotalea sp. ND16A]|uniref:BlaI/MecI/CopY family transcriptional regulator n=1 Tax=Thalassotalea sp. ND16A TaxID=1535422 RepID=UPI00051A4C65|nr:BlaI/MecI/CopY family transcriptional regulator [Thalassotalea sp. ND16A]KGJ90506.1 transcriptional repressor, CopY family [Thalassotalea sp. ND16A]